MLFAKIDYFLILLLVSSFAIFFIIITAIIKFTILSKLGNNNNFVSSDINPFLYKIRPIILIISLFFVFLSLLDPRWGSKTSYGTVEGIDLVLVLDISRSMLTKDVIPDRLTEAKNIGNKILSKLVGNRVGVTAFAGFAFNVLPLTTDLEAASVFVNELSTDMIDIQGTNLEDAIKKAISLFEENTLTHKAMIIITDGEDYEFNPLKSAKIAKEKGIIIFTVGIGTPNGGNVPIYDNNGNIVDYLKKDGKVVVSQLNEKILKAIAEETKGDFFYSKDSEKLLSRIDEIKKTKFGLSKYEYLEPQYQYFLFIALLLLLIYLFLPLQKINLNSLLKVLAISTTILIYNNSFATLKTKGVREYKKENYEEALKYFQKAQIKEQKNEKLSYNIGNTYYKLGNYEDSEKYYNRVIRSRDKKVVNKANYNLGNLYLERNEIDKAVEKYKEVLLSEDPKSELYKKALLNLLYAKQQLKSQQHQKQEKKENQNSSQNDKNSQSSSQKSSTSSSQSKQSEQEEAKPKDVENLLNLIKEEEKKYMGKKEKRKAIGVSPKNEW
ncbi:MAG: VWA domain-containing protein [Brevinematales bacterium]|nr:VWA domain-containing protein [Brevinematales bacterium]